jgi:hypothetical protein
MHGTPGLPAEHEALLRNLDASLRWHERRARAAHVLARAGVSLLECLSRCGTLWGMVPTTAAGAGRTGAGTRDADPDNRI